MRAHILDADGYIINTVIVPTLDFIPGLVDATIIGGRIGDRIVDGVLIPKPDPELPIEPTAVEPE